MKVLIKGIPSCLLILFSLNFFSSPGSLMRPSINSIIKLSWFIIYFNKYSMLLRASSSRFAAAAVAGAAGRKTFKEN